VVYFIGIDIGGTNIKFGAVSKDGEILIKKSLLLCEEDKTQKGIVRKISEIVSHIKNAMGKNRCGGIGIGAPGFIDFKNEKITVSPNFPHWKNFPLPRFLRENFKEKINVDNDANTFAIGEGWRGSASGMRSFLGITLGTGVGGGIVLDGKIWRGEDGSAGEFGHITVEENGPPCSCGSRGCVEAYVSSYGLKRIAERIFGNEFNLIFKDDIPRELFNLALNGDERARYVFWEAGRKLGVGIATVGNLLNIEGVIIGGGIGRAFRFLLPGIKEELKIRLQPLPRKRLKVIKSKLFERANILGAVYPLINSENF
jgi:glucokinase